MHSKRAFITLDALRGVAALAVISWHGGRLFGEHGAFTAAILAVDLFFILSGFVLTHAYATRLNAGLSVVDFVRMRLVRLYPLYLLGFLIAAAAVALRIYGDMRGSSTELGLAAGLNAFMLPNPSAGPPGFLYHFNFPAWSLLFELIANVAFAAFGARLSLLKLASFVVLLGAALVAVTLRNDAFDMGATWRTFEGGLARAMFGFFAGVLLYRLRERSSFTAQVQSTAAVCVLALITVATFLPRFAINGARATPEIMLLLAMVVYPVLIFFATRYEPGRRLASICAWLGLASYPAYVLHVPLHSLGWTVAYLGFDLRVDDYAPMAGLVFLAIIGLSAWAADRYWDRPLRSFLSQRLLPRAKGQAPFGSVADQP